MFERLFKAQAAGFGRGLLISLGSTVLFLGCLAIIVPVALLAPLPPTLEDARILVLLGGIVAWLGLITLVIFAYFFYTLRQRARAFDQAFGPYGLAGSGYLSNGRQYHGTYRGRQVDVYFYRGPILDIYVSTPLQTRVGATLRSALGGRMAALFGQLPVETDNPDFDQLQFVTIDTDWAQELLGDAEAGDALLSLLLGEESGRERLETQLGAYEIRQVILQPGAFLFRLQYVRVSSITSVSVNQWMGDLLRLARRAESMPAPSVTAQASPLEQAARTNRNSITKWVWGITCGGLGLLTVCLLVIMSGLIFWTDQGGY